MMENITAKTSTSRQARRIAAPLALTAAMLAATAVTGGAQAQFSGLAKRVVREAQTKQSAPSASADAPKEDESPPPSSQASADADAATDDPWTPLPTKGRITRPSELSFAPSVAEAKRALDRFGAYRCTGCEGGFGYDSWVRHGANLLGDYKLEDLVGSYAIGETLTWKGVVARGEMTIAGERTIAGFRCKQVRYTLVKGKEQASRPGLFCLGRPSPYSSTDRWVEVF